MRFMFVDAENIGLKEVETINTSISDKVFVFSKVESFRILCERKLLYFMSGYPEGSNQADFYIIGTLVGLIASLTGKQKKNSNFLLYSRDQGLSDAFSFQCQLHKVKFEIASKPKLRPEPEIELKPLGIQENLEGKILEQLQIVQTTESVRTKLKSSKSDFTRALNVLIKENKIVRISKKKKTWGLASST